MPVPSEMCAKSVVKWKLMHLPEMGTVSVPEYSGRKIQFRKTATIPSIRKGIVFVLRPNLKGCVESDFHGKAEGLLTIVASAHLARSPARVDAHFRTGARRTRPPSLRRQREAPRRRGSSNERNSLRIGVKWRNFL